MNSNASVAMLLGYVDPSSIIDRDVKEFYIEPTQRMP